jgi:tRNA threonylcarbamoyladenosine biosynthesis protein TsaB
MLLAIDTATRFISLALYDGIEILAESTWQSLNQHTEQLAPAVYQMMDRGEYEMSDLHALAVSTGPGSYTGLRIGIALAKGFATALKLPLIGVTTLDTLAASQPYYQSGGGLVVAVQAGRGRVIARSYRWQKGRWTSRTEPRIVRWESLPEHIDGPAFVTGEIDAEGMEALHQAQANGVPLNIVPAANRVRRAGYLAQIAWDRLQISENAADEFHASKLVPVYLQSEESQPPAKASKNGDTQDTDAPETDTVEPDETTQASDVSDSNDISETSEATEQEQES